jgi:hypothetical protein
LSCARLDENPSRRGVGMEHFTTIEPRSELIVVKHIGMDNCSGFSSYTFRGLHNLIETIRMAG